MKIWLDPALQNLREKRRAEKDSKERAQITKDIWKASRKKLREYRTNKAKECLEKFADFKNMEHSHRYPIKRSNGAKPDELKCAALLQKCIQQIIHQSTHHHAMFQLSLNKNYQLSYVS